MHEDEGNDRCCGGRGERVLRIPTHLTANARKSARQRGKTDPIDALNVARVALREGLESFAAAHLDGPELDLRLLVDHRERLVRHRVELNSFRYRLSEPARSVHDRAQSGAAGQVSPSSWRVSRPSVRTKPRLSRRRG
jgi:transposase